MSTEPWWAYVYVARCDLPNVCKIGFSYDPFDRVRGIKRFSEDAGRCRLAGALPLRNRYTALCVERRAHELLSEHSLGKEWFEVPLEEAFEAVAAATIEQGDDVLPDKNDLSQEQIIDWIKAHTK